MNATTGAWRVAVALVLVSCFVVTSCSTPDDDDPMIDLRSWLADRSSDMDPGDPYVAPSESEREELADALRATNAGKTAALSADARSKLSELGLRSTVRTDTESGKKFSLIASERGAERAWGFVAYEPRKPVRVVIEVPHPESDVDTEKLGADLFRRIPGSALVVAGAHRRAGDDGEADMAHESDTMFQTAVDALAEDADAEIQVHGYGQSSLPDVDAVPSAGPTEAGDRHFALAAALEEEGFRVCEGWRGKCGDLRGRKNVQGDAADERGTPFLHLELAPPLRGDPAERAKVVNALSRTWGTQTPK